jgi:hypothetical protein
VNFLTGIAGLAMLAGASRVRFTPCVNEVHSKLMSVHDHLELGHCRVAGALLVELGNDMLKLQAANQAQAHTMGALLTGYNQAGHRFQMECKV